MRVSLVICAISGLQACSLNDYTFHPLVYDLSASPTQVEYGQTSTLSWKIGGRVASATLNGESVLGMTSMLVSPVRRQTFSLIASSSLVSNTMQQTTVAARGLDLVAGNVAGWGNVNGVGTAARFASPAGIAVVSGDNVYVADTNNHLIRSIAPDGTVSTFAGLGMAGANDGPASTARFSSPNGVAVDQLGNLYVADTNNHTIRKITSQGPIWVVSTLVGSPGVSGSTDATGSDARFNTPSGVAVDGAGNIYVADSGNYTIRKVTPSGSVTTLAGSAGISGSVDGTGSSARFFYPRGVAVDGSGNLFVADTNNSTLRKVTSTGDVSTFAGSPGVFSTEDGTGSGGHFNSPTGVAVDGSGYLYVADSNNQTIRKVIPQGSVGVVSTLAGSPGNPGVNDGSGVARFTSPTGVAVSSSGDVYVADTGNHAIRKVTSTGVVSTVAGSAAIVGNTDGTSATALFNSPSGLVGDGLGNVYLADTGNHAIRKVTPAGVVSTFAGSPGIAGIDDGSAATARFNSPASVAVDGSGNVYVADTGNHTIRRVTSDGMVSTLAGSPGAFGSTDGTGSAARFNSPTGVAVDGSGNVYVADLANQLIRRVTASGTVSTLAGSPQICGSNDGTGSTARFCYPSGVAVDASGQLYVADTGNETIRIVALSGLVSTLAGTAGFLGNTDGTGAAARFNSPTNLTVDGSGNIYVTDHDNHTIRRVAPAGTVTTIAGTAGSGTVAPGPLPAKLAFPFGIALTPPPGSDLIVTSSNGVLQITAF